MIMMSGMETVSHNVQVCIVGGGLSGLCAALACARHGGKVLLMHDRPVLGGNASSEIRMHICGAHGENNLETGIIEELLLENQYYNPDKIYSIWDSVLYGAARQQPGLEILFNCACMTGQMEGDRLAEITGYQTTTQQFHRVEAAIFIDCSGDSVLAPITGAPYRHGREGRDEFGESIAPVDADAKTMGMSCLIQARKEQTESVFTPPKWARKMSIEDLAPYRIPNMDNPMENFWYLELGGENHTIRDTEQLRDQLLAEALGLWDWIKNAPENKEKNRFWKLDWLGFLPGKRESRRYVGAYVMHQKDVRDGGRFDDIIAYGGWTMDDHHPGGLYTKEPPTIFHPAPSPFGIPYRCLYSNAVPNLMFAGRNISVTHSALSATRVMATCALLGQAAGTAAAIAVCNDQLPADVYEKHLRQLQAMLMEDDCYLPGVVRPVNELTAAAAMTVGGSNASVLCNGIDRPVGDEDNGVYLNLQEPLEISFDCPRKISGLRLVFDSDLNRETLPENQVGIHHFMPTNRRWNDPVSCVPKTLVRDFEIQVLHDGVWQCAKQMKDNHQRLCRISVDATVAALRIVPKSTWGAEKAHLFAVDLY